MYQKLQIGGPALPCVENHQRVRSLGVLARWAAPLTALLLICGCASGGTAVACDQSIGNCTVASGEDSQEATANVLRLCGDDCKIVVSVGRAVCVAISSDEDGRRVHYGTGSTASAAKLAALEGCLMSSQGRCTIALSSC